MKSSIKIASLALTALTPVSVHAQEAEEAGVEESGEIIVTARKREESLQTVPVAVAAVTSESIDRLGLDNLTDISKTTAGLVFDDSFGRDGNRPVIRGQANILGQSGVAYFIDGIYYSGSIADYDVDSIERIEVVKGPQSALYGRNTYSGAINIISKSPGDTWSGRITADLSEHDRYDITAGVRGPLADGLGLAINGRYYDFGGEFRNAFDGRKIGKQSSKSVAAAIRYDDGGPFTAAARIYYAKLDDGQPAIFAQSANANNCIFDRGLVFRGAGRYFCGTIRPGTINTDFRRQFVDPENVGLESDQVNASFRVDYDLSDNLTLSSLTGYNYRKADSKTDGDYTGDSFQLAVVGVVPGPVLPALMAPRNQRFTLIGSPTDFTFSNRNKTEDWSQELRLDYRGDGFDILLGGYYFRQTDDTADTRVVPADAVARGTANANAAVAATCAALPTCGATINSFTVAFPESRDENNFKVTNKAVFGAINVNITDELKISAEGRYAEETIRQATFDFNNGQARPAPVLARAKFTEFTPRVTASYQATPRNLFYFTYAEGQKPGGFNSIVAINVGIPSFGPEDVESFELGTKNSFLDGAITANLALFTNKVLGYQLTQRVFLPPNSASAVVNAGDARIRGMELELRLKPDRNLTVTANYSMADSSFIRGFDEQEGVLNDVRDDGLVNCSIGDQFPQVAGCQSLFGSIKGRRIPRAPVHTIFADIDYRRPIGNGDWRLFAGANVSLVSSSFAQVHNLAKTGSSVVTDARLGIENDRYKIHFYVKNLFDEDAVQQIIRYADASNDLRRNFIAGLRPGRRFGLILSAGF